MLVVNSLDMVAELNFTLKLSATTVALDVIEDTADLVTTASAVRIAETKSSASNPANLITAVNCVAIAVKSAVNGLILDDSADNDRFADTVTFAERVTTTSAVNALVDSHALLRDLILVTVAVTAASLNAERSICSMLPIIALTAN